MMDRRVFDILCSNVLLLRVNQLSDNSVVCGDITADSISCTAEMSVAMIL